MHKNQNFIYFNLNFNQTTDDETEKNRQVGLTDLFTGLSSLA